MKRKLKQCENETTKATPNYFFAWPLKTNEAKPNRKWKVEKQSEPKKKYKKKEKQTNNKWVEEHGAEVNLSNGLLTYDCKSNE